MTKLISFFLIFTALFSILYGQIFVMAQTSQEPPQGWNEIPGDGLPKLPDQPFGCDLKSDGLFKCAGKVVAIILRLIIAIAIVVSVVLIAYSGLQYIFGGEKGLEQAKKLIFSAVIGLVIALVAWIFAILLVRFLLGS
ncbi:MAG: hypothetical protein KatS3mg093_355 [Candidatus Parcubacteria bacterium]|nr:MAG: hypothetical protein KatS3mg093_355 [Candidatus Parcubacteria bacterium]